MIYFACITLTPPPPPLEREMFVSFQTMSLFCENTTWKNACCPEFWPQFCNIPSCTLLYITHIPRGWCNFTHKSIRLLILKDANPILKSLLCGVECHLGIFPLHFIVHLPVLRDYSQPLLYKAMRDLRLLIL